RVSVVIIQPRPVGEDTIAPLLLIREARSARSLILGVGRVLRELVDPVTAHVPPRVLQPIVPRPGRGARVSPHDLPRLLHQVSRVAALHQNAVFSLYAKQTAHSVLPALAC